MDSMRAEAINRVRYAGHQAGQLSLGGLAGARQYEPTEEEIAKATAQQRAWAIQQNRREALSCTLALGRRYDNVADAIADAKEVAAWIGLEID